MSRYTAEVFWERGDQPFLDNRYSRKYQLRFDGGAAVPGSSSPLHVPLPMSDPAAIDPEEMFIGSLSSCHMLWFLSIAAKSGFRVDRYVDLAEGAMARDAAGKMAMSRVTLRPRVVFSGDLIPTQADIHALHHEAHEQCYIANSVKCELRCEPIDHVAN